MAISVKFRNPAIFHFHTKMIFKAMHQEIFDRLQNLCTFLFFIDYNISEEPYYLTPQVGSWEIVNDSTNGKIARQTVLVQPVPSCLVNSFPLAIIGDSKWYLLKLICICEFN